MPIKKLLPLTLTSLLAACSGAPTPGGTPGGPVPTPGGATGDPLPEALQGEWHYGTVSPIEYYDPATGQYAEASGTSEVLTFTAQGGYERVGISVVSTYGCTSKLLVRNSGTVKLSGDRLTLIPKTAYAKGYTCTPANTFERFDAPEAVNTWKITQSAGENVLVLGDPSGEVRDSLYNRPRGTTGGSGAGTVSGTVHLESGTDGTLGDLIVMACPASGTCAQAGDRWRFTRLPGSGAAATFTLRDVVNEPHNLFAWTDVNGNQEVNRGDLFGAFSADGQNVMPVTPPRSALDITVGRVE